MCNKRDEPREVEFACVKVRELGPGESDFKQTRGQANKHQSIDSALRYRPTNPTNLTNLVNLSSCTACFRISAFCIPRSNQKNKKHNISRRYILFLIMSETCIDDSYLSDLHAAQQRPTSLSHLLPENQNRRLICFPFLSFLFPCWKEEHLTFFDCGQEIKHLGVFVTTAISTKPHNYTTNQPTNQPTKRETRGS